MSYALETLGIAPPLFAETFVPETAEAAICLTYQQALRRAVALDVLQQDFSATQTQERLTTVIDETTPAVIGVTLEQEQDRDPRPLHVFLGHQAVSGNVSNLQLPSSYNEGLKSQVEALPPDYFGQLDEYHDAVSRTPYLDLARSVHDLAERQTPDWADYAYHLVHTATTEHFGNYALPEGQEEALYLLCFLPSSARSLTRRLIANSTHLAVIKRKLGSEITEDEQATLDAVQSFMQADVLTGQQWTDLALSEDAARAVSLLSVEIIGSLGTIQAKIQGGTVPRVAEAWWQARQELDELLKNTASQGIYDWESVDTGHCFNGFINLELLSVFRKGMYEGVYHNILPRKDGTYAVILEDDPGQMEAWQQIITNHLPQTTDQDLCFSNPEAVEGLARDPTASLFLLDIQNGQDEFAGIRVAESLLRQRFAMLETAGGNLDLIPPTKIIVWSASRQAVNFAAKYFQPITDTMEGVGHSYPHHSRDSQGRFTIVVRLKNWSLNDFPLERG